ncbi:MAG: alcohol dehydrogenase catalytic domain-containing protein [Negativicutes bacterium]|nr:alcohol dehydrogenase catalytic domain-containing protein [Negativicutes bacterium]
MKNLAAVVTKPKTIEIKETELPQLQPGWVQIKIEAVGICGTDLELYDGSLGYVRSGRVKYPLVPGHEFCGRVVAVGEKTAGVEVGDRVVAEVHIGCGACHYCRCGRYNLCPDMQRLGIGDLPGAIARFVQAPVRFVHKIPDNLALEKAVLIEPTSVCLHALYRANLKGGDNVLIFGPGPIGLITCALADCLGAAGIALVGTETDQGRLQLGARLGAGRLISVPKDDAALEEYLEWADIVVEATGQAQVVPQAFRYLKKGGTLLLVGLHRQLGSDIDYNQIIAQEKTVVGCLGSPAVWGKSIALLQSGKFDLSPLITHRYPLADAAQAFHNTYRRLDGVIKAVIVMPQE